ncbi:LysR family transcriptional regulator [Edwardsiella piscicida]|uniref:LysR family transcriptional regulator n=1 Tax=Edwardsiella piscicida TaxID=1263550 RepID=UPI00084C3D52|nr:LysR family transcriptional regulator [Edwardsiella piscicida]AOP44188.1 LysR family transcriptional regulator [Edwardsiella piscicida]EKS7767732.1 LysR family transcriptional regulator [Edwardsiella piscicida]UCQ30800.1 LysR family transcriptional regulator [Edwardsiella piscicida]UCQ57126.1 LysR family transcriptional regulator [Edwardsiella piscicida]
MEIGWLEDFLALAELRNFSRAAASRNITQPAFGRHIRALEQSVGQQLVDRSTTPVTLTPAGYQFRLLAHAMTNQWREGLNNINGRPQALLHPVRFSAPHSLSSPFLLDLIAAVTAGDPAPLPFGVDILRVDFAVEALMEGESDFLLAFDNHALLQPPFDNLLLGRGDLLLVSAPDANGQARFQPGEHPVPVLRYTPDSYSARMVERLMPQYPFPAQPLFEASLCDLHRQMALRGHGLTWLADCQIGAELAEGRLVAVDRQRWRVPYQIRLYRNRARLHQRAEAFWQRLAQRIDAGHAFWPPPAPAR